MHFDSFYNVLLFLSTHNLIIKDIGYSNNLCFNLETNSITTKNMKKTIYQNGKILIDKIVLSNNETIDLTDLPLILYEEKEIENILSTLYEEYIYSLPSEKDKRTHENFRAKKICDFTDEQMAKAKTRTEARYALNGFIILSKCKGLIWTEKEWFKKIQKSFVILKSWC